MYVGNCQISISNLVEVVAPLRKLTEKEVHSFGNYNSKLHLTRLSSLSHQHQYLKFYNIAEEVTLQCDASDKGLRATWAACGLCIKSFKQVEQNYAQI